MDRKNTLTLSVKSTAERLGISRASCYQAIERGELPYIRVGKRILVPRAALEKLLNEATPVKAS